MREMMMAANDLTGVAPSKRARIRQAHQGEAVPLSRRSRANLDRHDALPAKQASRHRRDWIGIVAYVFAVLLIATGFAVAQSAPLDREIWEKSQIFQPRPSFDTTPVTVKIVDAVYRIPRNYLTLLEPAIPTLRLSWPGLQPLTAETQKCFGTIAQSERVGCGSFSFLLRGSRGPGPGGRALTNSEKFENFRKSSPSATWRPGPFGYDIYSIGPEQARHEYYRRVDGDIFFSCSFSGEEGRKRGGVCDDSFRLEDMNHLQFFFRLPHIEHIPAIEAGMRKIMAGFVVRRE
jgi:hypothetical protein